MKSSTRTAPHVVYRCYDADDVLIYVGMTSMPLRRRMAAHEIKNPAVASRTVRIETERFPDRASAARAESVAIDRERPLLNVRRGADYEVSWDELVAAANSLPGSGAA